MTGVHINHKKGELLKIRFHLARLWSFTMIIQPALMALWPRMVLGLSGLVISDNPQNNAFNVKSRWGGVIARARKAYISKG